MPVLLNRDPNLVDSARGHASANRRGRAEVYPAPAQRPSACPFARPVRFVTLEPCRPTGSDRPPLDVALAMLTLVPGDMGGSETYARALIREFAGSSDVNVTAYVAAIGAGFSQGVPERVISGIHGGASTRARAHNDR